MKINILCMCVSFRYSFVRFIVCSITSVMNKVEYISTVQPSSSSQIEKNFPAASYMIPQVRVPNVENYAVLSVQTLYTLNSLVIPVVVRYCRHFITCVGGRHSPDELSTRVDTLSGSPVKHLISSCNTCMQ